MKKIYNDNGLPFYTASWIRDRRYIESAIADTVSQFLRDKNPVWVFHQIEAPCLIPAMMISSEYDRSDVYITDMMDVDGGSVPAMGLKPETTASSYAYAEYLIAHQEAKPPLCVWQASKSFRRESDQVSANVRLKEFYQQEFQCIVTDDTKMDYQELAEPLAQAVAKLLGAKTRVVDSDRLPNYSQRTIDIEAKTPHKWLEICSISKRTDVPFAWTIPNTRAEKNLINYELAFGLDRCVYVNRGEEKKL